MPATAPPCAKLMNKGRGLLHQGCPFLLQGHVARATPSFAPLLICTPFTFLFTASLAMCVVEIVLLGNVVWTWVGRTFVGHDARHSVLLKTDGHGLCAAHGRSRL